MLAEYRFRTYFGIGLGVVTEVAARLMVDNQLHPSLQLQMASLAMILGGAVLLIYGCRGYMRGKGYDPAWGWLGLFSVVGVGVLTLFPDRYKGGVRRPTGGVPVEPSQP